MMITCVVDPRVELELCSDEPIIRRAVEQIRLSDQSAEHAIAEYVWGRCSGPERRLNHRQALVRCALLMPVEMDGDRAEPVLPEPLPVVTLDVSRRGIGFHHDAPLPCPCGVMTFDDWHGSAVSLLVEQRWSRGGYGSLLGYRSGCRILAVVGLDGREVGICL